MSERKAEESRSPSLASRIAWTIAIPLVLYMIGDRVLIPGVPDNLEAPRANMSIFALGVMPIFSAYGIVEVIAFLVPPWSRRRHAGPAARRPLEIAARVLMLVLAATQGLGVAMSLSALGSSPSFSNAETFSISIPITVVTLVGGVLLYFFAAQTITRRGLANGFAVILGVSYARELFFTIHDTPRGDSLLDMFGPAAPPPSALLYSIGALIVVGIASWVALRSAGHVPADSSSAKTGAPYRGARTLVIHPWVPIPASSFEAYFISASLLMLPATLSNFGLPFRDILTFVSGDASTFVLVGLVIACAAGLSFLLHRPAELASLASSLGAADKSSLTKEAHAAVRGALLPTIFFFVILIVARLSSHVSLIVLPIIVAVGIDVVRALTTFARDRNFVTVWEERRVTAMPVLRAALASQGISSRARGASTLALFQVFAPLAPAEILVTRGDEARARAILGHLIAGEAAPEGPADAPITLDERTWTTKTQSLVLGGLCFVTVACAAKNHANETPIVRDPVVPAKLEIVRVDDEVNPFENVRDEDIPGGNGIAIYQDNVPAGQGHTTVNHFARCMKLEKETALDAARARCKAWLETVPLKSGDRFALEDVTERDDETNKVNVIGVRTFVLTGPAELGNADIADAAAAMGSEDDAQPYVAVTLTPNAAARFEALTRDMVGRRIAIVLDGNVESAPVVRSAIAGGRVSITMGVGDPEDTMRDARKLERRLRQH